MSTNNPHDTGKYPGFPYPKFSRQPTAGDASDIVNLESGRLIACEKLEAERDDEINFIKAIRRELLEISRPDPNRPLRIHLDSVPSRDKLEDK